MENKKKLLIFIISLSLFYSIYQYLKKDIYSNSLLKKAQILSLKEKIAKTKKTNKILGEKIKSLKNYK